MSGDPYWSDVVFLSGFEGASVVDESPLAQTVTVTGAAQSTTQVKYGSKSLAFTTINNDIAQVPDNAAFFSGNEPFTIEGWFYWTSPIATGAHPLIAKTKYDTGNDAGNLGWQLLYNTGGGGYLDFLFNDATYGTDQGTNPGTASWNPTVNTWVHICCDYDGTTFRVYVNGAVQFTNDLATITGVPGATLNQVNPPQPMSIGAYHDDTVVLGGLRGYVDEVRVTAGVARYAGAFTAPTAAFPRGAVDPEIDETITVFDGVGDGANYFEAVTEALTASPNFSVFRSLEPSIADTVGVTPIPEAILNRFASASDTATATDAALAIAAVLIREALRITDTPAPSTLYHLDLSDTARLTETLATLYPITITEALTLTDTLLGFLSLLVGEKITVTSALASSGVFNKSANETISVSDLLLQLIGLDILETITVSPSLNVLWSAFLTLTEAITVSAELTPLLLANVTAADTVEISDVQALQMLWSGDISEEIEVSGGYVEPDGSITTWAVNTRTGAVSEYQNYAFNSFARTANKYVGASSTGVYELLGDDDAGADITARLQGGFLQFGGTQLSRLKAVYIAPLGEDGQFVLKVESGDGQIYLYEVDARSGRSTKVHMGKGQRSRYFAWELTSVGQDFRLDTLEFVPLVVQRRV